MIGRRKKVVLYSPQQADERREPPYSKDVLPLSLLQIAGGPVADGYEVVLIDGALHAQREAHRQVLEACEGALLYATTGILGYQVADGFLCTQAVKARFPDLPAFIGGWFASVTPELQLATGLYDAVAIGQGELTFRELVQAVDSGEPLDGIAGLALLRDGETVRTAPRGAAGWSHLVPTPWHLLDPEPYRQQQWQQRGSFEMEKLPDPPDGVPAGSVGPRGPRDRPWFGISYYSSFGCPLQCTFCCSPEVSGLRWKAMPADAMLDDLAALQERWQFDVVRFYDANWGVMEKRVRAFAEGKIERELPFWYYPYMQSVSVLQYDTATLDALAASGAYVVLLGGETGTDETMQRIKKNTRGDGNLRASIEIARRGMTPHVTFIIGFPGEDEASMRATIDQVRRIQVACPTANPQVWPFRPLPGTPLFEEALAQGFRPPRTLLEWGGIGDYRWDETWPGNVPDSIARLRRLLIHFSSLSKGGVRGRMGWWERRARRRLESGDFRFGRLEAKAFDLWYRAASGSA